MKGTFKDAKFQAKIEKRYVEEITDAKEIYRDDCNYIPLFSYCKT